MNFACYKSFIRTYKKQTMYKKIFSVNPPLNSSIWPSLLVILKLFVFHSIVKMSICYGHKEIERIRGVFKEGWK